MGSKLESFEALLSQHPHILYATPSSKNYEELREAYILDTSPVPLAIARPTSAEDVAVLVQHAVSQGVGISVRGGGHDLFGRCFATDALAIDMRDIAFVQVAEDRGSATIGGGVLATFLAAELGRHKLATAVGSAPTVGWVGWATHGGYGPFVANYGLGVDQILGAKVVGWEGKVLDADETMLEAIRGGGGSLGVIVEMTIKVYELSQVLGGVVVFKADNFSRALERFSNGYDTLAAKGLPDALGIQRSFVNTPMGTVLCAVFVWSSDDLNLGRHWLHQIESLGEVVHNSVIPTTVKDWLDDSGAYVPKTAYGGNCTVSVTSFDDDVVKVVGEEIAKMPADPATLFSAHELRGRSALPRARSVFAARMPHYVFEFIATSSTPDMAREAWVWASGFRDAVRRHASHSVLPITYVALTPPSDANFPVIYGKQWQRLQEIKKMYDPNNVFCHAIPQF